MIKTKDIVKAVNTVIKSAFPDRIVVSTDKDKAVKPGSFYVEYPAPIMDGSKFFKHESGTIYIDYFPPDRYDHRLEFFNVQEKLREVFADTLTVEEDFVIPINELQFTENDDVLILQFDYDMWQYVEETGVNMEELIIKEE